MHGSEPFLTDLGLLPVASAEKDSSMHLYRRNSCHQERLNQDLQKLRSQEERVLRRANREIIELNMEQKKRRETLNRPRRRSESLGLLRRPNTDDIYSRGDHRSISRFDFHGTGSNGDNQTTVTRSPLSSSPTVGSLPRRRASISTPTSLPPLPIATASTTDSSCSSPTENLKSRSFEQLHSTSSTAITVDSKSMKDFTRLKNISERWRKAAQQATTVERTGKPPIPTSSFTGSSHGSDHEVHKTSKVFDRLTVDTKSSSMSSDNFLKVLKNKYRTRDATSKTKGVSKGPVSQ